MLSAAQLILLANFLSRQDYATFGLYFSVSTLFYVLVNLGHKESFFKLQSQAKPLFALFDSAMMTNLMGGATCVLIGMFVNFEIALAMAAMLSFWHLNLLASLHRGKEHYSTDAVILPAYRFLWLLLCGLFLLLWGPSLTLQQVYFSSIFASILCCMCFVRGLNFQTYSFTWSNVTRPKHGRLLISFFSMEIVSTLVARSDMLLLEFFALKTEVVAKYFFSIQVMDAVILLLAPVSYIFFNKVNRSENKKVNNGQLLPRFIMVVFMIWIIGFVLWQFIGNSLLALVFPLYMESFTLISYLLIAALLAAVNMIMSMYLFAINKELTYVKIVLSGFVILVTLNLTLLPVIGIEAAILSRVTAEFIMLIFLVFICRNTITKLANTNI